MIIPQLWMSEYTPMFFPYMDGMKLITIKLIMQVT